MNDAPISEQFWGQTCINPAIPERMKELLKLIVPVPPEQEIKRAETLNLWMIGPEPVNPQGCTPFTIIELNDNFEPSQQSQSILKWLDSNVRLYPCIAHISYPSHNPKPFPNPLSKYQSFIFGLKPTKYAFHISYHPKKSITVYKLSNHSNPDYNQYPHIGFKIVFNKSFRSFPKSWIKELNPFCIEPLPTYEQELKYKNELAAFHIDNSILTNYSFPIVYQDTPHSLPTQPLILNRDRILAQSLILNRDRILAQSLILNRDRILAQSRIQTAEDRAIFEAISLAATPTPTHSITSADVRDRRFQLIENESPEQRRLRINNNRVALIEEALERNRLALNNTPPPTPIFPSLIPESPNVTISIRPINIPNVENTPNRGVMYSQTMTRMILETRN